MTLFKNSPGSNRPHNALISGRVIIFAAAVAGACAAILLLARKDETFRRVQFATTGCVTYDAWTFYLNPADEHLTQVVLGTGAWEAEETQVFRQRIRPGDTVIDVGANIGWYTVIASRLVGDQGRVFAFEPDPINFEYLKRNVEMNGCRNVVLEQKALSNEPGKLKLFLNESNLGMHSTALPQSEDGRSIEVEALRLDDYLQGRGGPVHFVKIDVEGAEGFVLDGMKQVLESQPRLALLLEFAPERLTQAGYEPTRLLNDLEQSFRITQVDGINRRTTPSNSKNILRECTNRHLIYINLLLEREQLASSPSL